MRWYRGNILMVKPANPKPCSSCPWLISNHGKPHPDGWFTKKNRDRLWAQLRKGESMSCHKTDPDNRVPEGTAPVSEDVEPCECTGALILQQREVMKFQEHCKAAEAEVLSSDRGGLKRYRAENSKGMTHDGLAEIMSRAMLGGTPFGGLKLTRPNLNEPVGHDPLTWEPHE